MSELRNSSDESDVFISHASEDKESVARPLADALRALGWKVWLDEFQLAIGDSLSARIDTALAGARFGVVVLSPAFFSKPWPQRELAGLAAREIDMGSKIILPVWHNVDHEFIVQHSPVLADRLGALTSTGIERVAENLSIALERSGVRPTTCSSVNPLAVAVEKAQDEPDGASLLRIPSTPDEQEGIVNEQPDFWEYLLFAGTLMQGRLALEDQWQDHELRLPGGPRRLVDQEPIGEFLSREMGWVSRQIAVLDRVFSPLVIEKTFGASGQPGNPRRIRHLSDRVIQIYEGLMDWAATLRNTNVASQHGELVELTARMVEAPLRQIREFTQTVADEVARFPVIVQGASEDRPATVTLTLKLSLDEAVQNELHAAINRVD